MGHKNTDHPGVFIARHRLQEVCQKYGISRITTIFPGEQSVEELQ
jgi:hypothetical protein